MAAVLVVGVEPEHRERLRQAVEREGHAPLLASSAPAGLDRLREGGIDLAVVHYTPEVELDVFADGLQRLPDPPPFLIVSSLLDAPAASARYGAAEFVAWPTGADELPGVMTRLLAARGVPVEFEDTPTRPNERRAAPETF